MVSKTSSRKLLRRSVLERDAHLVSACRDKDVLHVGCTDAPFTRSKYQSGDLLHSKLQVVARKLAGVDIDAFSIHWLSEQGLSNLHIGDASQIENIVPIIGFSPDIIIAGEVLEHLSHPLDFLLGIRKFMRPSTKLLLSVPNAFYIEGFVRVALGFEKVHPEHVAYYSYFTLQELLARADLRIADFHPCTYETTVASGRLSRILAAPILLLCPHLAPGYVVQATLSS
jgi:2-polyprenyl-3-methyl-5-hydroxy-6-metoxy-1,4-benzoquinol methylase